MPHFRSIILKPVLQEVPSPLEIEKRKCGKAVNSAEILRSATTKNSKVWYDIAFFFVVKSQSYPRQLCAFFQNFLWSERDKENIVEKSQMIYDKDINP